MPQPAIFGRLQPATRARRLLAIYRCDASARTPLHHKREMERREAARDLAVEVGRHPRLARFELLLELLLDLAEGRLRLLLVLVLRFPSWMSSSTMAPLDDEVVVAMRARRSSASGLRGASDRRAAARVRIAMADAGRHAFVTR